MLAKIKRFIAPPQFPEDDEIARVANLLNTLLWLFLSTYVSLTVFVFITGDGGQTALITTAVVNVIPIYLLKRRLVKAASWTTLILLYGGTFLNVFFVTGLTLASVSSIFVLTMLSGLLLGRRVFNFFVVLSFALLNLALYLYLQGTGQIIPQEPDLNTILILTANIFLLGVTLNLTLRDFNRTSNRMRQSNEELLIAQEGLEQMVAARTHALESAADVGRSMSRIRELDALLQNTVNSIAEQFNLYYVQIYLADKKQQFLSLKSGTGSVGQQMARRGHKLPFGGGSINGMAAAEQQVVLVADTAVSSLFKPNVLLPNTRSEMAVPLMLGDVVVGVLDLQSDAVNGLSGERLPAFEALAGQIAIAIENARLFTETAQARSETEAYLRQMTRQGWADYFDAIQRPEQLSYSYDAAGEVVAPGMTLTTSPDQNRMQVPIVLGNEVVGTIELEADDDRSWTSETLDMVTAVAQQVGQRAENLRLFGEAEHSRFKAEQANRRLTRDGWHAYQEQIAQPGFVYDGIEVKPLTAENDTEAISDQIVSLPLQMRGESIGQIVLDGLAEVDDETQALLTAVAHQLSDHIESLRLGQQTELALAQTDRLYKIGRALNAANAVQEILDVAVESVQHEGIHEATLMFVELDGRGEPETLEMLADWRLQGSPSFTIGTQFPLNQFPFTSLFMGNPHEAQFISNVADDERVDEFTKDVMLQVGIQALVVVPLTIGGQWVSILTFGWALPHRFSQQSKEFFNAFINMAAPVVQSQRLYAQTRKQAEKERLINLISQKIQGTVTMKSALESAVKELGQALQTTTNVRLNAFIEKTQTDRLKEEDGAVTSVNGGSHK